MAEVESRFPFWWHGSVEKDSRHLFSGRVWLHRRHDRKRRDARLTCISAELTLPCSHCGWSVTFGGGDGGRNLGFTLAIPFLLTLYVTIDDFFKRQLFAYDFDRGSDRQIGVYFFEWAIWYHIWVGTFASWSRSFPWCRWWRQGSFHFANLLGKQRYTNTVVRDGLPITVAMPEGRYVGTAKFEVSTWKRPLWFTRTRLYTTVDIPKGIPFAGKGENSWDCGDDGLFGYCVEGHNLEKAAQHGRDSVLASRKRYGSPSERAIAKALTR